MFPVFLLAAAAPFVFDAPNGRPAIMRMSPERRAIEAALLRFPPPAESMAAWYQSVRYRDWQRGKRRMGPTAALIYADQIAAAEWLEKAWDLLTYAQAYRHSEESARDYLRRLRVHLGDDGYERGLMPAPAPDWWKEPPPPKTAESTPNIG